jgi:hypothetical protein
MAGNLVQLNMGEVAEWFTSGILPDALRAAARSAAFGGAPGAARKAALLTKSPGAISDSGAQRRWPRRGEAQECAEQNR